MDSIFWNFGGYHFFDYKYNIFDALGNGYGGQDFDGTARWIYMAFTLISILVLALLLRKMKHKSVERYLKIAGFVMMALEATKIIWETWWDIKTGHGFNALGLIPIYTCSMFMYVTPFAGFGKGLVKRAAVDWLVTVGLVAGLSNVFFIQGLKWYPFWTFGAMYSMFFHYLMVFTAALILATGFQKFEWKDILLGFVPLLLFSLLVVPIDYLKGWDYMQFYEAGGIPIIEDVADKLSASGQRWLVTAMMYGFYLAICAIFISVYIGVQKLAGKIASEKAKKTA